jgi:hypothetical protein
MPNQPQNDLDIETIPELTAEKFYEEHPPGQNLVRTRPVVLGSGADCFPLPDIQLHCPHANCAGPRFFRSEGPSVYLDKENWTEAFVHYRCSNCRQQTKIYAICCHKPNEWAVCFKFGEYPAFGPHTPARLLRLIQPDKDLFLQGRRSENHGLGIGAMTYYRRVVEDQKNRIFDEVKKVCQKLNSDAAAIALLDKAIEENQFAKALEIAKDAIPESLLIDGQNPLALLHSALSEGIHGLSDDECLRLAGDVRVVLTDLSENIAHALKQEAELHQAVTRLLRRKRDS